MEYPDNNPKTAQGLKKLSMHAVPPAAIRGLAEAFGNGVEKYGLFNWRHAKISSTVYYAAAMRHLTDWYDRVDIDDAAPDSHIHHLKHAMACMAMVLDTMGTELLNDDRPPKTAPPAFQPLTKESVLAHQTQGAVSSEPICSSHR